MYFFYNRQLLIYFVKHYPILYNTSRHQKLVVVKFGGLWDSVWVGGDGRRRQCRWNYLKKSFLLWWVVKKQKIEWVKRIFYKAWLSRFESGNVWNPVLVSRNLTSPLKIEKLNNTVPRRAPDAFSYLCKKNVNSKPVSERLENQSPQVKLN